MSSAEHELLVRWQAGDNEAGGALIDAKYPWAVRFFRNKVASIEDEADLVQQTFARLVESRDRIRDPQRMDGFVFTIARNVLFEYIRRQYKARKEEADFASVCVAELDNASPTTMVHLRQQLGAVVRGLRGILLEDQILLELRFFESATAARIAMLTGIPRGSVDRRMAAALTRLRNVLGAHSAAGEVPNQQELDGWVRELRTQLPGASEP